ncbi:cytochrome P450 [Candidatus Poriferisodalis sp.]|uniref:cytochrome P450 n=1 Tax=Candidatus Poriferisodalis sp. TaxID=3101277 RepID=UPI003B019F8B
MPPETSPAATDTLTDDSALTDETAGIDIADARRYAHGIPWDDFGTLRRRPGLHWNRYEAEPNADGGFWAVTRHADVCEVSRHPERFSSAIGHVNLWDLEADALEARRSILEHDPPAHTRLRRVVSKAFTPRQMRRYNERTREIADELLDAVVRQGGGDWVDLVAAPLPIRVIIAILGVPPQDADYMVELSNHLVEGTTESQSLPPDAYGNTTPLRLLPFGSPAAWGLYEYGAKLGDQRLEHPTDDVVSHLVHAEVGGDRLTATEFRNFFQVLVFGGNETTRTAITHGTMAFADHPEQWDRLVADRELLPSAVEEVIRWASPILHMRRTAAVDTELSGTPISAGDKVVMWYPSANRDEAVFERPNEFDIGRADNAQIAFGGGGPHFCLGAYLARMELTVLLEAMLDRGIRPASAENLVRIPSNFVHGVASVDVTVDVSAPAVRV